VGVPAGRAESQHPTPPALESDRDRALREQLPGAGTSYIELGSPWQNPYVESFGGRLRDELLAVEAFNTLLEAQVLVEDWRIEYNTVRPHSALGYLTPADYAKVWTATYQPQLSY
jgi:putative transposase